MAEERFDSCRKAGAPTLLKKKGGNMRKALILCLALCMVFSLYVSPAAASVEADG